ncbi:nucleotidyltransferase family protein [uncultured Clostridium sp.]|uniref:nucleotidyltransferase domain-containing protein n=1 Tax=uncultured Clostridium sp. TaxID=59620 RepID=UPI0025923BA8|nr:nucleotidyltransferase family protein [uncultured Clostridium sp.]MBQ8999559.1 nucleotidyltransferase family protein [Clostridium sp.]
MTNIEKELINILSNSIHGTKCENINTNNLNLKKLFNEAKYHKVEGLIYNSIDKSLFSDTENLCILEEEKKSALSTIIAQSKHIKIVSQVLNEFNKNDIPVIVLKGLFVRNLYPNPNLRTMCDADILVHPHDLNKIEVLLTSMGYKKIEESDEHGAHIVFYNYSTVIEVHWRLTNTDFYKGDTSFEEHLWDNVIEFSINNVKTLSLGLEDLALHLCIHMAVHLACHGFGIRQLCDLVLLVEKEGNNIDWNLFLEKAQSSGIEKFSLTIFKVCNLLFNMEIPKELNKAENLNEKYINLFIKDIFNNGVSGRKDESLIFANEIAFDTDPDASITKKFLNLLFPTPSQLNDKYNYAKKCKILLPIAWIHHLFEGVNNKDYSLISKIKILTNTISTAKKRNKLMNWLEI